MGPYPQKALHLRVQFCHQHLSPFYMGAHTPPPSLLPPRILSVPGVKSEGWRAKKRKKKRENNRRGVRESSESLSLLLSDQSPASFSFQFRSANCPRPPLLLSNQNRHVTQANHLMAREVLIKNWKTLCNAEDRLIFTKFIKICVEKVRKCSSCFKQLGKRKYPDLNVWIFEPFRRTFKNHLMDLRIMYLPLSLDMLKQLWRIGVCLQHSLALVHVLFSGNPLQFTQSPSKEPSNPTHSIVKDRTVLLIELHKSSSPLFQLSPISLYFTPFYSVNTNSITRIPL